MSTKIKSKSLLERIFCFFGKHLWFYANFGAQLHRTCRWCGFTQAKASTGEWIDV